MNAQNHDHSGQHGATHSCCGHNAAAAGDKDKPHTDPVCGMKVAADPAKSVVHDGQTHFFCSQRCVDKFKADPNRYLHPPEHAEPELAASPGTIYTCPMHPEVRQPAPGSCPKCGMALEPEMPTLDDGENHELVDFRRRFWWTLPLTVVVTTL
ncbi:MAG: YHS domain-containing protein, partial [Betaproteobacteria bacterium]|nr:YHS domain-containing protein [Betaproteobacteria bacterium]